MTICQAIPSDLPAALAVERAAFVSEVEAGLVRDLLADPGAQPVVSLLAYRDDKPVGHILFTKVRLEPEAPLKMYILAPLAVVPAAQKQGVGSGLVKRGLRLLTDSGTDLVFVLGHPEYYPRFGFVPAGRLGFDAPYPIPPKNAGAWMVQALRPGIIGKHQGKVVCSDSLNKPEYWRDDG